MKKFAIGCGLLLASFVGLIIWLLLYLRGGITSDPTDVRKISREILPIEAPDGMDPEFAVDMFGAKFAVFQGKDDTNRLIVASISKDGLEESEADWKAQTLLADAVGTEASTENSVVAMRFGGQSIDIEMALTQTKDNSYRSFLATLPAGENVIKLFRIGDAGTVNEKHFQALLDEASKQL
ncbi:MAG: hypothetical protein MK209_06310 [Planctomycetes bacterium]|nr:hypothetical protein [Planctomycetota bacterium]